MEHMPLEHKHHHHHHHRYHGHFRHPHPYHDPNSTAWNGQKEWFDWIGDKRHFRPWYDPNSDYNTNAKSYYDYLGYRIRLFDAVIDQTNELLRRDIVLEDSATINFEKDGDWQSRDDILTIKANAKISQKELNAIHEEEDGLWSEDFQPKIDDLQNQIDENRERIEDLEAVVYNKGEFIEIPNQYVQVTYFNGTQNSPDKSLGTTYVRYCKVNNNVMLQFHFNWYNDDLSRIRLSGQVTKPFESRPESVIMGITFTGEYAWLNNLARKLTDSWTYGALIVNPTSARAGWKPDYSIFKGDGLTRPAYSLVIDTYSDGYNSQWTFKENYGGAHLSTTYGSNIWYYATYQIEE